MSVNEGALLEQARAAIRSGRQHQARLLLIELLRANPRHATGWLWLASVTSSPVQAERYVTRAEMLQPDDPAVRRARVQINRRLQAETAPAQRRRGRAWQTAVLRAGIVLIMLLLLVGSGWLMWQYAVGAAPARDARQLLAAPYETFIAGDATVTVSPTAVPLLAAQPVTRTGELRATWTPMPTPSLAPTATPTVPATFVSPGYTESGRPPGVRFNERWIDVNLTTQTLTAYEGDTAVFSTLISSGKQTHPTVTGQFRVWLRYESQTMNGRLLGYDYYLENVPYVMYFYNDYALHGAYWHNNFGTPMSHGCVNMHPDEAAWLFNWSSLGTVVNVHY